MDITNHFKSLINARIHTRASSQSSSSTTTLDKNNIVQSPTHSSSSFPNVCGHIATQLDELFDQLTFIKSLYITPQSSSSSSTTTTTTTSKILPDLPLHLVNTTYHDQDTDEMIKRTVITIIYDTAKQHYLTHLPLQWSSIIDTYVKDTLNTITTTINTIRTTMSKQRDILDNVYKINTKDKDNNIKNNIVTLDRTPIERFINDLRQYNHKKYPKMTPEQSQQFENEYNEIHFLSYQTLQHQELVLVSLETIAMQVGKYIISLEKERKRLQLEQQTRINLIAKQSLSSLNQRDGNDSSQSGKGGPVIGSIVYSIAPTTSSLTSNTRHKRSNHHYHSTKRMPTSLDRHNDDNDDRNSGSDYDQGDKGDDDELSTMGHRRRNSKPRTNPFAISVNDEDINNDKDDGFGGIKESSKNSNRTKLSRSNNKNKNKSALDLDNNTYNNNIDDDNILSTMYGITSHDLIQEKNQLKSTLEEEEFTLATQVEQHLSEITTLISTFQNHIVSQSQTIDNIYQDIIVVNHNIDYGNDQLSEALERGGWGAKFYMYLFILCAMILLLFDWVLN